MVGRYKPYPEYKASGVSWLGDIPSGWKNLKLGKLIEFMRNGSADTQVEQSKNTVPITRIESISTGAIDSQKVGYVKLKESLLQHRLQPGDIQISNINSLAMIGNCAIFKGEFELYAGMNLLHTRFKKALIQPAFALYFLKTKYFRNSVEASAKPAINQASIPVSTLKQLSFLAPSLAEQTQISAFLDHETAKIDALIAKQQRLIALLEEKRQAVISHAVIKGLNPNAPLRPSAIDWIGEVPAHWAHAPLKYMALEENSLFLDGDWIESKDLSDDGIRYITTGNVGAGSYKEQGAGYISTKTFKKIDATEVFEGDILVSRLNAPIGRACVVPDLSNRIVTSVDNVVFRPDSKFHRAYVVYMLSSREYFAHTSNMARGATMQRISRGLLGNIRIVFPPLSEQIQITDFLKHETAKFDVLATKAQSTVTLLKERRTALISAAVTGKIDVRDWQPPKSIVDQELETAEDVFA